MGSQRFVYRICWKNRKLLSGLVVLSALLMFILFSYHHGNALDLTNRVELIKVPRLNRPALAPPQQQHNFHRFKDLIDHKGFQKQYVDERDQKHQVPHQRNIETSNQSVLITPAPIKTIPGFKPLHRSKTYRNISKSDGTFSMWLNSRIEGCEGRFNGYDDHFAWLKDIVIDREYGMGAKGGEDILAVVNQPEEKEYYIFNFGFFQLPCKMRTMYNFEGENHLNEWLVSLKTRNMNITDPVDEVRQQFTIAVTRYEYVNLYHTMTDFYNAFILMELFNKTQTNTNILFIDGHPKGSLDVVWKVLFNSTQRISDLPQRTRFQTLVWSILGYNSPLNQHNIPMIPLVPEFRTFFLSSFRIRDIHSLNCDKPSIMFIWRKDYMAHPRNPTGHITRKIDNEQELMKYLRWLFPHALIKGIQIDTFDMQKQLELIVATDILIGMHGAGLTHALFLPQHAGVVEFLPTYWSSANIHFKAISRWRGIHFERWENSDPYNEKEGHFTKIPPSVLHALVKNIINAMCPQIVVPDPPEKNSSPAINN